MQVITAEEAARLVQPGWTVACAGFVGAGHAEAVTHALERRFLATGEPRDLTLVYSAGQGDRATRGVNHFGNPGMTRCVVGGHWRSATRLAALALAEQCEAFNLPQGVLTHLYRAIAGGKPGVLTRIGLHTFVDPRTSLDARYHGAAINARARAARAAGTASWVEYERFRGEDYLFYPRFPLHCVFLRAPRPTRAATSARTRKPSTTSCWRWRRPRAMRAASSSRRCGGWWTGTTICRRSTCRASWSTTSSWPRIRPNTR